MATSGLVPCPCVLDRFGYSGFGGDVMQAVVTGEHGKMGYVGFER